MNVIVEQRGTRSVEVVRQLVVEFPDGADPTPADLERVVSSADEMYGPFQFSPVRRTQNLVIHSTKVISRTWKPADVPMAEGYPELPGRRD